VEFRSDRLLPCQWGLIFKAAGNDGADSPDYISGLSGGLYERVIKVAATDENDCKADFSNFGNWVTLSAREWGFTAVITTIPILGPIMWLRWMERLWQLLWLRAWRL